MMKKGLLKVLMLCMLLALLPATAYADSTGGTPSGRLIIPDKTRVTFGSYPQTEIVGSKSQCGANYGSPTEDDYLIDADLYAELQSENTKYDSNGDTTIDGTKYRRIKATDATNSGSVKSYSWADETSYHYFRYEPIVWKVLSGGANDGIATLVAEDALDCRKYNDTQTAVEWADSSIRSWLNDDSGFVGTAFTSEERTAIDVTMRLDTENKPVQDEVYLLSESDVSGETGESYGFSPQYDTEDPARQAAPSTYGEAMGTYKMGDYCAWWLLSNNTDSDYADFVTNDGDVDEAGVHVDSVIIGVRPALHLNMAKDGWSYVATAEKTEMSVSPSEFTYDGYEQQPNVKIDGLTYKQDYTLTWENNKNAGTATVTATGTGSWIGTLSKTFTINPKSIKGATVELSETSYTYDGKAKTPSVTVKAKDETKGETITLVEDTDYTVSYSDNQNAGQATVTVTGIGNYTGEITANFTINKADPQLTFAEETVSKKALDDSFTNHLTRKSDGKVSYTSSDENVATIASDAVVTITGVGTTTITGTVAGTSNFEAGSASYTLTVSPTDIADCTATLEKESYTYDGTAKEPSVTLKYNNTKLQSGTDYTFEYEGNVNAGTAAVVLTGKDRLTGTVRKEFKIEQAEAGMSFAKLQLYKSVTSGNFINELTIASDGQVSYESSDPLVATVDEKGEVTMLGAGDIEITASVKATNNYLAQTLKYRLVVVGAKNIARCTVTPDEISCDYDGTAQEPAVTVADGDSILTLGEDYEVVYEDNVNAGIAKLTVRGIGENWRGEITREFTINKGDISSKTASLSKTAYVYNGSFNKPAVVIEGLTAGTDYTVKYADNKYVGMATVTIKGTGSCTGTLTRSFRINPKKTSIRKLTKAKKAFTAKWKKQAVQTSGYQLQYSLKASMKSAKTVTIAKTSRVSKKVSRLKSRRKYYVRVRTYKKVKGKKYYSAWSAKKKVKTK